MKSRTYVLEVSNLRGRLGLVTEKIWKVPKFSDIDEKICLKQAPRGRFCALLGRSPLLSDRCANCARACAYTEQLRRQRHHTHQVVRQRKQGGYALDFGQPSDRQ